MTGVYDTARHCLVVPRRDALSEAIINAHSTQANIGRLGENRLSD